MVRLPSRYTAIFGYNKDKRDEAMRRATSIDGDIEAWYTNTKPNAYASKRANPGLSALPRL
jgi:predicted oxidoreductase